LMYFSVVVLVIVNGQPTTDDDIDKQEISELISVVAELRAELAEVKDELVEVRGELIAPVGEAAPLVDNTDTQTSASKSNCFNNISTIIIFVYKIVVKT